MLAFTGAMALKDGSSVTSAADELVRAGVYFFISTFGFLLISGAQFLLHDVSLASCGALGSWLVGGVYTLFVILFLMIGIYAMGIGLLLISNTLLNLVEWRTDGKRALHGFLGDRKSGNKKL